MKKNTVLLAQNSAFIANRLPRAARALKEVGYDVEILNWDRGVNSEIINIATETFQSEGIKVHSIYCGSTPYGKGIITLINKLIFILKVISFLVKNGQQYNVVHAIDFDLAFPVYIAKKLNSKLKFSFVYDIADFVETFHSPIPKFIRNLVKKFSESIMKNADCIILPDENRLINIPTKFYDKVLIVNNSIDAPKSQISFPINTSKERLNVFYYGALSKDRGIELLLEQSNVEIWLAGKGELQEEIIKLTEKNTNIHYLGYLSFEEVLSVANKMDVIYMVYDPTYQHNQIASPNKLYEALYLGKPCIVCENTSIDHFVRKYDIGYVINFDSKSLHNLLQSIAIEELSNKGNNAKNIYPLYSWENSKQNLIQIYREMMV